MIIKNFVTLLFIFYFAIANGQIEIYVAPGGNDNNLGTKESPLASIIGARDFIRNIKKKGQFKDRISVIISSGEYVMQEPLTLTPEDSGTLEFPITYQAESAEHPIFSGGKRITGFKINDEGLWEVQIPETVYYNWRFDQLYVNDKRAILARTPNKGYHTIHNIEQNIWEKGGGRVPEKAQQILTFDEENFNYLNQIDENEVENVRFRAYHKWDFTLRYLDKIDSDSMAIYTSGKGMKPWNPIKKGGRIIFENFRGALDEPGEWFLNNRGVLFYKPLPGETIENSEIIAPVLENLISIEGYATNNEFVEYIYFSGLTFKHCHYKIPKTGSEPNQAAALLNAAVMLEGARNIGLNNCEISQTGQHAIWIGKGCNRNVVKQCYLNDLGGGGIYLGDFNPLEGIEHTSHIQIENNIIQTGGQEFPSAVGIWVGHSSDNEILHNDISNFYYTGISVGWIWGYGKSLAKRNKIMYNNIHHIGWALLSDMAAVYTLGRSEGTIISNNVIHHVHAYSYGGWGLYPDEGSSDILMENNLVYSTKTGGFHQHYGKNNIIRNNIFAFSKLYQAQCTRVEKHLSFTFENNIIIYKEGVVLKGAWAEIDIVMDKNLYWNLGGTTYDFNGTSFTEWQKTGHDKNSIIEDPNFNDAASFDFRFKNKKSIKRIDFEEFNFSKAGVYGSEQWMEKAKLSEEILVSFDKSVENNMKKDTKRD